MRRGRASERLEGIALFAGVTNWCELHFTSGSGDATSGEVVRVDVVPGGAIAFQTALDATDAQPVTVDGAQAAVVAPGAPTLDDITTVDEDSIADAMVLLMERAKLYVEGAGAVGVAALLADKVDVPSQGTTCVVLSGGNVDLGVVPGLIRRRENAAGRRLTVFVKIDDRPGGLAALLSVFAPFSEAGTPDLSITTVVDTSSYIPLRWQAIRAHASQTPPYDMMSPELQQAFLVRDHFIRVDPPFNGEALEEDWVPHGADR